MTRASSILITINRSDKEPHPLGNRKSSMVNTKPELEIGYRDRTGAEEGLFFFFFLYLAQPVWGVCFYLEELDLYLDAIDALLFFGAITEAHSAQRRHGSEIIAIRVRGEKKK